MGVESHTVESVRGKVYCAAKSVGDWFEYRNRIGVDVRLRRWDALRGLGEIWRVARVMRDCLVADGFEKWPASASSATGGAVTCTCHVKSRGIPEVSAGARVRNARASGG